MTNGGSRGSSPFAPTAKWLVRLSQREPASAARSVRVLTRMLVMTTLSLSEIKARLSELVDQVEREHDRIVLTRNGVPAAVLMSPDDLEALEDSLALLSDPAARAEIEAARREIGAGELLTADDLRAKYLKA